MKRDPIEWDELVLDALLFLAILIIVASAFCRFLHGEAPLPPFIK